jgi:carbamoyl-phosphate synthase large subunit
MSKIKKTLILGSGALKIGEAGEFDYSGSQAIKALKEEGIKVILVNPNVATRQTDSDLADKIYFLPIDPYFIERIIKKEKPDSILLSFGGQTALNCGVKLARVGILNKYKVKVLGTQIKTIEETEDRNLFRKRLKEMGVKVPKGKVVKKIKEGLRWAEEIGYPVLLRTGYALGGKGSGLCRNEKELIKFLQKLFSYSKDVLIEEYLDGWKEIEYEMIRDKDGNTIAVCNMENIDPLGIHTGESIVVAPSQTLTNEEYHFLREVCKKIVNKLEIIGECNVQLALSPNSGDYRVIELNARLSRSSALASKASGYPLAFIGAKLSLGYSLWELENKITKITKAFFEPALDYVVIKIPRWDFEKFRRVEKEIGSEMKSVGEVMAIGRNFEESLQKAIRSLDKGYHGLVGNDLFFDNLKKSLKIPNEKRIMAIAKAIENGLKIEKISQLTKIDSWFLWKIKNIVNMKIKLEREKLTPQLIKEAKKLGFSDWQIGKLKGLEELEIRDIRKKYKILPVIKQIDTMAAEWPAKTNYLYLTYNGSENDLKLKKSKSIIILGSGAYRIGSSVEFDWCCCNALKTAKKLGYETVMINYNPETVSTDFDECDRLYFEELSLERVLDIYEFENPKGMIVSMGGQIPNNLAYKCFKLKLKILGTNPQSIDKAENRSKFSKLLDEKGIFQPPWHEFSSIDGAIKFAREIGYPILVRPSYVLSGQAMTIVFNQKELQKYLLRASRVSREYPVVISKFLRNAKEVEMDGVALRGRILKGIISEHIELAGVHSGDAYIITPPQKLNGITLRKINEISKKIVMALKITGPFNIQFLLKENNVSVIECNLRASRSFPFVSKVHKVNLAELATKAILNGNLEKIKNGVPKYCGVKVPQFSFSRLKGADPLISVEMASTGEVGCLGENLNEAFLKSFISAGNNLPEKNVLISIGGEKPKKEFLESVKILSQIGYNLYGTIDTAKYYRNLGIKIKILYKIQERKEPNILTFLKNKKIDFFICILKERRDPYSKTAYIVRRTAIDYDVPFLSNIKVAKTLILALKKYRDLKNLKIKSYEEYK